jgi:hypothetical protein
MPTFEITPEGSPRVGISPEDLAWLGTKWLAWLRSSRSEYLRYDLTTAAHAYGNQPWLELQTASGCIQLPYTVIHDYRTASNPDWGSALIGGHFVFPPELLPHRAAMVRRFKREGRLPEKKKNSLCPRLTGFSLYPDGRPRLVVERAMYTDQVGTNLTLDYPLTDPIEIRGIRATTVREWDRVQSQGRTPALPEFETSRLANTIGVSIAVTCNTEKGAVLLQRKRREEMAVHQRMWSTPFAFVLTLNPGIEDGLHDLATLISQDYGHEFAQELQMEHDAFTAPRPLALCRDLTRGGKPQFFFQISTDVSFEEIVRKVGKKGEEYSSPVRVLDHSQVGTDEMAIAPELLASATLLCGSPQPGTKPKT